MSSDFAMTRGVAAENAQHNWLTYAWSVVGVAVLIAGIFLAAHLLAELHAMSTSLTTVTARLGALEAMDRKLDTLQTMNRKLNTLDGVSGTLSQMDGKLGATNRALQQANVKLSSMNSESKRAGVSLRATQQGLAAMRSDIHTMVHKISGSFLFRSVK